MAVGDGIRQVRLDAPVKDDGKPIVCAAPGTRGSYTTISSKLDDLNPTPPNSGRAEGPQLFLDFTSTTTGYQEQPANFNEPVEIRDANCYWRDSGSTPTLPPSSWDFEDMWGFFVTMPGTVVTPNGSNEGNCTLYEIVSGYNLILPADGDGDYDVDLDEATPVPDGYTEDTPYDSGYWDCMKYWTGVISAGVNPPYCAFNLYDFDIVMYFVHNIDCGHAIGEWRLDADEAEWLHPSWELTFWCNKTTSGEGKIGGNLMTFRPGATL